MNKVDPKTSKGLKFGCGVYRSNLKNLFILYHENDYIKNILNNSTFKFKRATIKNKISDRTNIRHLEIAKALYKTIDDYNSQYTKQRLELKAFMYLFLMSGHRYGELLQLTTNNLILEKKLKRILA